MVKTFKYDDFEFEVEVGKVAKQADGAVWLRQGGTIVLSTVVAEQTKEFPGFLPLSIDYREQYSAAGKIPGGYYKREGKLSDREVLTSRLIDRAIRPLFPATFFEQIQILSTVYSVDKEHTPNTIALLASSLAVSLSDIPFLGPVGVIELGRVNGKWIVNPLYPEMQQSDVRLVVAGTKEGISMVEGSMSELSEKEFVDALFLAHDEIKKLVAWQETIIKEVGKEKKPVEDPYSWKIWKTRIREFLTDDKVQSIYVEDKVIRNANLENLQNIFIEQYQEEISEKEIPSKVIAYILDSVLKEKITKHVFKAKKRVDGRSFDTIRPISSEVGLLPFAHGSSLFTRGRTQALASVTLGGGEDVQRIETLMDDEIESTFMLHYNFPPFAGGDIRPMRGPGRREIGHGHLAASAFKYLLPDKESFPYTIRIITDILESDGSSSMATACASTMALMQAGVPIKKMVGGVAMGLLIDDGNFVTLSDIAAFEDAFGLMDFKVVGTDDGVTAIQMDIKYKGGLKREVFESALEQARKGRLHILGEMRKTISAPNPTLSDLVPKVVSFKVDTDKIGAIIGSGGKTIREIIDVTKTSIDIEPDGLVKIFGGPGADLDYAIRWVKTLAGQIEKGSIFEGKVKRIADFGLFVELVPGLDGLAHVSNIPKNMQKMFAKTFKTGDIVRVEVLDYDDVTGRVSLRVLA